MNLKSNQFKLPTMVEMILRFSPKNVDRTLFVGLFAIFARKMLFSKNFLMQEREE
jgi:hypothetical protein